MLTKTIEIDGHGGDSYDGCGTGRGEENLGISGTKSGNDGFGCSFRWCKSVRGDGYGCGEGFYYPSVKDGDGEGCEITVRRVITIYEPSEW